jgi:hypothetical protein
MNWWPGQRWIKGTSLQDATRRRGPAAALGQPAVLPTLQSQHSLLHIIVAFCWDPEQTLQRPLCVDKGSLAKQMEVSEANKEMNP